MSQKLITILTKNKKRLIILFVVLTTGSCLFLFHDFRSGKESYSYTPIIENVLNVSGSNRNELEKVLIYYKSIGDKQKYEAAKFLISNCYVYFFQSIKVFDDFGNQIIFDPSIYGNGTNKEIIKKVKDSIIQSSNVKKEKHYDCKILTSDYLIDHIEKSFNRWHNSPWYDQVNFNQFCEYILPYRAGDESLSQWQTILHERYRSAIDTLKNKSIVNVTTEINKLIANDLKYVNVIMESWQLNKSVPQMLETGFNLCDDLGVFGKAAMCSFGIPTAVDFTIWARANTGHVWCVVFDEMWRPISFGPGEQHPEEHVDFFSRKNKKHRTLGKVFRRTFKIGKDRYIKGVKDLRKIPPFFRSPIIKDVTHEYVKTFDIKLKFEHIPKGHDYLYLCVWNDKDWRPIHWGNPDVYNNITFTNVGADLLFCIGAYDRGQIMLLSDPFLFTKKGKYIFLNTPGKLSDKVCVSGKIYTVGRIKNGDKYSLLKFGSGNWQNLRQVTAIDSNLFLNNLHEKTLYRLDPVNNPYKQSRPFTLKGDSCIWW